MARPKKISASDAARHFSDLVNRVLYRGDEYIVERAGEPVCRIVPLGSPATLDGEEAARLLEGLPPTDDEFARDIARVIRDQPRASVPPWPEG